MTILLKSYWVLAVMVQFTRRIIGFGVHSGVVDGSSLCRMFNRAIGGVETPKYISSDHDPLFEFRRWKDNLRILDVAAVKTVPYVPISHPFVERVIGTFRREYLDQVSFGTTRDLERKLLRFKDDYNNQRTHHASNGVTLTAKAGKLTPKVADLNNFRRPSHCEACTKCPSLLDRYFVTYTL